MGAEIHNEGRPEGVTGEFSTKRIGVIVVLLISTPFFVLWLIVEFQAYKYGQYLQKQREAVSQGRCIDYNTPPLMSREDGLDYILDHRLIEEHCPSRTTDSVIKAAINYSENYSKR